MAMAGLGGNVKLRGVESLDAAVVPAGPEC